MGAGGGSGGLLGGAGTDSKPTEGHECEGRAKTRPWIGSRASGGRCSPRNGWQDGCGRSSGPRAWSLVGASLSGGGEARRASGLAGLRPEARGDGGVARTGPFCLRAPESPGAIKVMSLRGRPRARRDSLGRVAFLGCGAARVRGSGGDGFRPSGGSARHLRLLRRAPACSHARRGGAR